MDPFRDELAAAHAKIAELEDQIRQLHTKPPTRSNGLLYALLGIITLVMIGAGAAFVMIYR